jgi:hypothetical protein
MKKLLFVMAAAMCLAQPFPAAQAPRVAAPLPSFAEPGISPDGSTIAFVSGGDIWEVAARGPARRRAPATATSTCSRWRPASWRV